MRMLVEHDQERPPARVIAMGRYTPEAGWRAVACLRLVRLIASASRRDAVNEVPALLRAAEALFPEA